jgi:hypothetical protein
MPNPNALVDFIVPAPLEAVRTARDAGARYVTISFQAGRSGQLDLSKPHATVWASVLDSMQQSNLPVYVEIDPGTNEITNLLVPLIVGVESITPVTDGMEVTLLISHAKHFLRRSNPDFEQLLAVLERARADQTLVAVTETEGHDIIDVRPLAGTPPTMRRDRPPEPTVGLVRLRLSRWRRRSRCLTWWRLRSVAQRPLQLPAFRSTTPTTAAGGVRMRCAGSCSPLVSRRTRCGSSAISAPPHRIIRTARYSGVGM